LTFLKSLVKISIFLYCFFKKTFQGSLGDDRKLLHHLTAYPDGVQDLGHVGLRGLPCGAHDFHQALCGCSPEGGRLGLPSPGPLHGGLPSVLTRLSALEPSLRAAAAVLAATATMPSLNSNG